MHGCTDYLETTLDELSATIKSTELGSFNVICVDFNADLRIRGGPRSHKDPDRRGLSLANYINHTICTPLTST